MKNNQLKNVSGVEQQKKELEIYLHIPFCQSKCAYCDFLSFPASEETQRAYMKKLVNELQCMSESFQNRQVSSVFIGGGTPSMIAGEEIETLMRALTTCFCVGEDTEITIEANPGTLTLDKLKRYRSAQINRISLGLQSADDRELRKLGRIHTFEHFLDSYQKVRQAGFHNVNVDLMSGLPGQTLSSWKNTLKKVAMLKPEHISAYSLILEQETPFFRQYSNYPHLLPDEDTEREMYELTKTFLLTQGYQRYEISNYAKAGYECRHNIGYWTDIEYLGVGLGASSYLSGRRFHNERTLQKYLDLTDLEQLHQGLEELDEQKRIEEFMFLGLRLSAGVSGHLFLQKFGCNMWDIYGTVINRLAAEGLVEIQPPQLRLTDRGIDLSNFVLSQFLL